MAFIKQAFAFLLGLLNFSKWFTDRKDARAEKAHKTEAVKHHDENSTAIDDQYR